MADTVTIRAQALNGEWETIGVDRARGVRPENVTLQADLAGPSKASFDLRRDPRATWPDLTAFTPIEVEVDSLLVWGGRIAETPARDASERVMNVQCDGWQYHLDDDTYERCYVHTKVSDWQDTRSRLGADLARWGAKAQVSQGNGVITLGWAKDTVLAVNDRVAVSLDLGPVSTAARCSIDVETANDPDVYLFLSFHDTDEPLDGAHDISTADSLNGASFTKISTPATPRRHVTILLEVQNAHTASIDAVAKIKAAHVFGDTAYAAGGTSGLTAGVVIRDALDRATTLLNRATGRVGDTSFVIPEFALDGDHTPREVATAVNALHDWLIQVAPDASPVFRPKPTVPIAEIGAWPGSSFEDASANSGDEIYTRAIVTGQDAAGNRVRVPRTQTGTLVDRRGFQRSKVLPVRSSLTTAVAEQMGDIWLTAHRTTPLKGTARVTRGGARSVLDGTPVHPAALLTKTGEMIRLSHVIDPDTASIGRDARIAGVTYRPAASEAEVTLDNSRSSVEALFERLAVVTGAG